MNHEKIEKLTTSSIMIALSVILHMIAIVRMPQGGELTPCSLLPVCMISIIYGLKWGLGTAFTYSVVQLMLGFSQVMSWGLSAKALAISFIFDYIIGFTVLGLAGLFRKQKVWGIGAGIALAFALKYIAHVISGVTAFSVFMPEEFDNVWVYSLVYSSYLLPEMLLTIGAAYLVCRVPAVAKLKTA